MSNKNNNVFMQQLAAWARANGKPRPTSMDGMKALTAEFMRHVQRQNELHAQQAQRPSWEEVPDDRDTHLINDGATVQIADARSGGPSDFDELVEARASAVAEFGGDELAGYAQHQHNEVAALGAAAPWMRTNPLSVVSAIIGGQAVPNGQQFEAATQPVQLCSWNGEDPDTKNVIVNIAAVTLKQADGAAGFFESYGIVQFGTRGFLNTVEVDVGQQFVVGASTVIVQVKAFLAPQTLDSILPPTFVGMLSFGNTNRTAPLTRTKYIDTAVPGGTPVIVTVPPYAKNVVVWRFGTGTPGMTILFEAADGSTLYDFTIAAGAYMTTPIPLTPDVFQLAITPATNPIVGRVIFELGL